MTWTAKLLKTRSDVDLISEKIASVGNDIAHVHAKSKANSLFFVQLEISFFDRTLASDSASDSSDGAREFRHPGIAGNAEHAAVCTDDDVFHNFAVSQEPGESQLIVRTHDAAILGHIRRENRSKTALELSHLHVRRFRDSTQWSSVRPAY